MCDLVFFCLEFFLVDRVMDFGRFFIKEVGWLFNYEGLIFNYMFGKMFWGGNFNIFIVKWCDNLIICFVVNFEIYVKFCDLMKVEFRDGFFVLNFKF